MCNQYFMTQPELIFNTKLKPSSKYGEPGFRRDEFYLLVTHHLRLGTCLMVGNNFIYVCVTHKNTARKPKLKQI